MQAATPSSGSFCVQFMTESIKVSSLNFCETLRRPTGQCHRQTTSQGSANISTHQQMTTHQQENNFGNSDLI